MKASFWNSASFWEVCLLNRQSSGMMQGLGKKKDKQFFVSQSEKNVNHIKCFEFSHCGLQHWNLNSSRCFLTWNNFSFSIFFVCFYCLTLSMLSSRPSCLLLQIPSPADIWPCPSSAPHPDFDSKLINLSFFRLPWTDMDGNEGRMRAEKKTVFFPSLPVTEAHKRNNYKEWHA